MPDQEPQQTDFDPKLKEMLARAFPKGVTYLTESVGRAKTITGFLDFLTEAGFKVVLNQREKTARISLFIGDPHTKRGLEMVQEMSIPAIQAMSKVELTELLAGIVCENYTQALVDAARHGFRH